MSIENNSVAQSLLFYIENNFEGSFKKLLISLDILSLPFGVEGREKSYLITCVNRYYNEVEAGFNKFLNMREMKESLFCNYTSRPNIFKRVGKDHYKIQDALNLIVGKKIPYSLSKVAKLLECDRKLLTKMYPNECREIRINYLKNIEMKNRIKIKF